MVRSMLLIAGKDLRLRLRDRSVFIIGLIAPAALALIFTVVFGDVLGSDGGGFQATYGYVDLDDSEASRALSQVLDELGQSVQFDIRRLTSVREVEAAIDADEISAAFVVPEGFDRGVTSGGASLEVIGNVDAPTGTGIAQAIAEAYASSVERVTLTVSASLQAGADPTTVPEIVSVASQTPTPATIEDIAADVRQMDGTTFAMAGMAVFFLFFTVQFGVTSLLEERQLGTWNRLMAAPLTRGTAIGAKALVSFVLGVVSMTVLMIGASLGLGASWGDPLAVGALVVAGVGAATAIMALVASFARTPEGAGNIQSIIAVTLGMLGGAFFPVGTDGGLLAGLSLLTPHAWFLRGLNDLAGGGGIGIVVPSLLAIGAFALVAGGLAVWGFTRKEAM